MPYLTKERKEGLDDGWWSPETPGDLNYALTRVAITYVQHNGLNYTTINDIIGAFTAARDEFTRRVVIPYETRKATENGDIYEGVAD